MKRRYSRRRTTRKRTQTAGANAIPELPRQPTGSLQVQFGPRQANGTVFPQAAARLAPTVSWAAPPPNEYRTLLCFDPDAPAKSWLHWLVTNATGPDPTTGQTIMRWAPPTPPSGTHRYYFVLFRHTYPIAEDAAPTQRGYFQVAEFLKRYGLEPVSSALIRVSAPSP